MAGDSRTEAFALVGGRLLTDLQDVADDPTVLDRAGWWAVVISAEGAGTFARFGRCESIAADQRAGTLHERALSPGGWPGIPIGAWTTSLDEHQFGRRVDTIRAAIAAGDVYQVNLTRRLRAMLPTDADPIALAELLAAEHPAPFAATVCLPDQDLWVVSASPERFLSRRGNRVTSSPIKGTAVTPEGFTDKDRAENVMIVDLVRNDLGRVCEFGSVQVSELLSVETHPGLAHLVSTVDGELRRDTRWSDLLAATFPPGSVTGAPKLAALDHIARLETTPRGVYCGTVGWVDGTTGDADLNVAIRTFTISSGMIEFGTGGGITWDSTSEGEWNETELKAQRLLSLAATASRRR